jgi:hypothetical protein
MKKKCIYSTYSPLSSTHLCLRCSNFFNPYKKNSFGCAANRKNQRLISTPTYYSVHQIAEDEMGRTCRNDETKRNYNIHNTFRDLYSGGVRFQSRYGHGLSPIEVLSWFSRVPPYKCGDSIVVRSRGHSKWCAGNHSSGTAAAWVQNWV